MGVCIPFAEGQLGGLEMVSIQDNAKARPEDPCSSQGRSTMPNWGCSSVAAPLVPPSPVEGFALEIELHAGLASELTAWDAASDEALASFETLLVGGDSTHEA